MYSNDNGIFLIITEGERVVGCGGLRRLERINGELVRLWLRKERRKIGLGRMVFEKLIRAARERGYEKVYLDTSNRCADAVRLFRKNGFVECGKYKESVGDVFLCRELNRVVENEREAEF